jgi:hypothetical protein
MGTNQMPLVVGIISPAKDVYLKVLAHRYMVLPESEQHARPREAHPARGKPIQRGSHGVLQIVEDSCSQAQRLQNRFCRKKNEFSFVSQRRP